MSYTANKLIAIAADEVGYIEKTTNSQLDDKTANAGSNNWTKYARDLAAAGYYNGNKNGYAWCDVFVDWCFYQLTNKNPEKAQWLEYQSGPYGAGCNYSAQYYRMANAFSQSPAKGAQIFFGSTGNEQHTGIVENFDNTYVYTIEGNANNQVMRKTYRRDNSYICGYGIPRFDKEEEAPKPSTNDNSTPAVELTQEKFNEMMEKWINSEADKGPSAWSKVAREWAESHQYIVGDGNGRKMYQKFLTREEFFQVLYRIMNP